MSVLRKRHIATSSFSGVLIGLTLAATLSFAAPALADDPRDPTMTPDALARDREIIRRLNRQQLEHVQKRDAQYAQGWRDHAASNARAAPSNARNDAYRVRRDANRQYAEDQRDYEDAQDAYVQQQRDYQRQLKDWRRRSTACRSGFIEECG